MLTRLELVGFKSFADKTRFDFAPGITAVVGPNGSGKSNIVDAVKWILGEQSAKSLRGGEMADVIFNGSSTRKSLGMAEVTMTFDNAKRQLRFDGGEVQITRRVYRDGQGEYLINGQMARLKDIKELFLGSGAGQGAYSIIEQGRVDALLTASTKDRRQIFEEAAGISRFKAKKLEALRKLDHTEQNLNRVRDILQELEKNLRTLSAQAAKAQKYQEYHARLKDLRIALGLREYREIADALAREESLLAGLRAEVADATARTAAGEEQARALDEELTRAEDGLRHQERRLADARQRIAEQEAVARSNRDKADGLGAELLRLGRQRADFGHRLRTLEADAAKAKADAEQAAAAADGEQHRADAAAAALNVVTATIAELTRQAQADRAAQFELVAEAARLHAAAEREAGAAERLQTELARKQAERDRAAAEAEAIARVLADLSESDAGVQHRLAAAKQALADLQREQADLRRRADAIQPDLDALRERRSDLRGRAEVLEGLERSYEGFGAGVRAVLERLQSAIRDPRSAILGLVADLLTVPRDVAPLIDVALGPAAERFVVRDAAGLDAVLADLGPLPGRVGFIPAKSQISSPQVTGPGDPTCDSGTCDLRLASSLVRCDHPDLATLPRQLLGDVLLVEDLAAARTLSPTHPGYRFVTRSGELLEPDGTLTVGPPRTEAGILSRKSELRELREQAEALDAEITRRESEQVGLRRQADALDAPIGRREAEIATLAGEAGELRDRILQQGQKRERLAEQADLADREMAITAGELQKAEAARQQAAEQAAEVDRQAAAVAARLDDADTQLRSAEQTRAAREADHTAAQVALGRARQQLAGLQTRSQELDDELRRRKYDAYNLAADERSARVRLADAELAVLQATQAAADAYREKEARERLAAEWSARRAAARAARDRVQAEVQAVRDARQRQRDQAHAHELTVRDLTNRRDALAGRIRDDYGVELADVLASGGRQPPVQCVNQHGADAPRSPESDDPHAEIDDLKRKIAKLGSVNLEALEQLAVEEAREKQIRSEYDDLVAAEKSLLEIIEQINADSRALFAETLAAVRGHFQELFRKLFGGGMADIVLEDPNDVLETGIEITARPPGKELRSISLMSGGEKTLTAVALLLAIFRSRPSPFCLLDEVDAALDEANTARLAGVLREFLDRSQFIVITHKKRTMAAADVLYGITMQESGVSKQVATRLDDWPDEEAARAA